ncbi:uncharacterized protein F5Z01DRAFT_634902 [Emericellopsis atlantica]|uniref:C2H2-type domain-containing protein n=1 Tax=Emericellopsis atlantica TaxID=2614577 RepID=A0A9P7ZQS5_9HYPO|nr:uncharacterized protein F5Z01DRAFT_634902 [Emericellopsis atlantica]KAG9255933.1 hypothetical protein F5Z01DRAFT_634902 [Emericellopsis atlantica]
MAQTSIDFSNLDDSDIASIESDDLHTHRPNRWTGPASTWRHLTEEERLLWHAYEKVENENLGIHLYNVFALRKRAENPATMGDVTVQLDNGSEAVWTPPKMFTAWPLIKDRLPEEHFVKREDDEDEPYTYRKEETKYPSTDLREELNATILRMAKQRFRKRKARWDAVRPSVEDAGDELEQASSEEDDDEPLAPAESPQHREHGQDEDDRDGSTEDRDDDHPQTETATPRQRIPPKTYEPIVSLEDHASLLNPISRHIISQVNKTLSILSASRTIGLGGYDSDSSSSSDTSTTSRRRTSRSRRSPSATSNTSTKSPTTSGKRGRPRKVHARKAGETDEEMATRVAREMHRALPPPSRPASADNDNDSAFEAWLRTEQKQPRQPSKKPPPRLFGLRDWSDVVSSAALAGFSPDVIARTTQRCANLFGEGMVMRSLHELPADKGDGVASREYRPERIPTSDMDSDDGDGGCRDGASTLLQRRVASRQSSFAASDRSSPSRSRSRSASVGTNFYCPLASCPRAGKGFARRANLRRHMELLHPGAVGDVHMASPGLAGSEVDSEDEVYGAVHVDGFLKPIAPGRGWREQTAAPRERKRRRKGKRGRGHADSSGSDGDISS